MRERERKGSRTRKKRERNLSVGSANVQRRGTFVIAQIHISQCCRFANGLEQQLANFCVTVTASKMQCTGKVPWESAAATTHEKANDRTSCLTSVQILNHEHWDQRLPTAAIQRDAHHHSTRPVLSSQATETKSQKNDDNNNKKTLCTQRGAKPSSHRARYRWHARAIAEVMVQCVAWLKRRLRRQSRH